MPIWSWAWRINFSPCDFFLQWAFLQTLQSRLNGVSQHSLALSIQNPVKSQPPHFPLQHVCHHCSRVMYQHPVYRLLSGSVDTVDHLSTVLITINFLLMSRWLYFYVHKVTLVRQSLAFSIVLDLNFIIFGHSLVQPCCSSPSCFFWNICQSWVLSFIC